MNEILQGQEHVKHCTCFLSLSVVVAITVVVLRHTCENDTQAFPYVHLPGICLISGFVGYNLLEHVWNWDGG